MPQYNKLVRDRIPEIIMKEGKRFSTRILDENEYVFHLNEKLKEELAEYLRCQETNSQVEELADMLEVILALAEAKGVSHDKLEAVRSQKTEKRGAFKERILLEWVED